MNGIVSLHDKNGLHNNLTGTPNWQLNLKFTDEYRQRLLTSYGKENIYLSRNGEWARKIHIDTAMPVSTDDAGSRTRVLDAQGREAPKDAQGRYLLDKGNYALIQEKDGLLRIEPWQEGRLSYFGAAADDWSSPQDPYSAHHSVLAGIEDAGAPGAFSGKRVIANLFSASGHDTPQEQRALHSYDVGLANGYNQAYLSLYTWQLKNEQGQYPGGVHNIGVFNKVDNEYFSLQNRYGVNGETLDVSYSGVAYSNKDGQQDGVLNMQAHFRNQLTPDERANAALDTGRIYGAIDPYRFSYEGKITGRHHDDGRDIYFASGNVRTDDGSMPQHQGQEISIQDSTGQGHLGSLIGTTTVWMQGQNPGEEPVIYGSGDIIFAGPHVEEVGGLLKITTSHGPHTIGFVGKRD